MCIILQKCITITGAQLGWGGGRFPQPFFKNQKSAMILKKKALIASILMLNLLFKI